MSGTRVTSDDAHSFLWFHALVSGVAMLAGLILVALGGYLHVRNPLQNIKLVYVESASINSFLSVAFVAIIAGSLLVFVSILGICVARAGGCRFPVIISYTILTILVAGGLGFIATVTVMLGKGKSPLGIDRTLEKAWINTVAKEKDDACQIQEDFNCFGFKDAFCVGCGRFNSSNIRDCSSEQAPWCPICQNTLANTTQGCYGAILNSTMRFYTPIGVSSGCAAGILLLDVVLVCAL